MGDAFYPLLFDFVYKNYVWGGTRIPAIFDRPPRAGLSAESWEISARPEGPSTVVNGPLAGRRLSDVAAAYGADLLGKACGGRAFPLLIKVIDARQRLSLQVHPDERGAALTGGQPKTEMWYFLDAEPGATIFAGLKPGVDRAGFLAALERRRLEDVLSSLPVKRGDAVFVPGGRVHAIGAGCLLLEVQQDSNTTYRVYDWGRLGSDGRPRELHVGEALRTIDWEDRAPSILARGPARVAGGNTRTEVLRCPFFVVTRLDLREPLDSAGDGRSFHALFTAEGGLRIQAGNTVTRLGAGRSCLIPAALPSYRLVPETPDAVALRISLE
ncbi:MAG: mannose-6-phosphate isomerase [Lentisphaerae bacterium]|nr:mannose-6-phosphate isomerase [Lentisphaerota bacterium]